MRKYRLDLNALAVESFDTASGVGTRGTVRGHDSTEQTACGCETAQTGDFCVDGDLTKFGVGCPNSAFPCQSVNACTLPPHDLSREFPNICVQISWPACSAKCTNMAGCTTIEMGC